MATVSDMLEQAQLDLQRIFGYRTFRPGQKDILEAVLQQNSALVIMPTGGGKSLCFQLPALQKSGLTLVVSPLISLMKDQVDSLQLSGYPATFINSSLSITEQQQRVNAMRAGEYKLIYIAPERFSSAYFMDQIRAMQIDLLAVDEAHCISQWGHDFRPAYTRLKRVREQLGNVQTIALTATATQIVQKDIVDQLGILEHQKFVAGFDRPNLHFAVDSFHDKLEGVLNFVQNNAGVGIVYAATRKNVEQVVTALRVAKISCAAYHAGLPPQERRQVQEAFLQEKIRVIVATNAFGMGIDKSNVRFVLHFGMPGSLEAYYQEAGRAGRDGERSECVLFYSPEDRFVQEFFIANNNPELELLVEASNLLQKNRAEFSQFIPLQSEALAAMLGLQDNMFALESIMRMLAHLGHITAVGGNRNEIFIRLIKNPSQPDDSIILQHYQALQAIDELQNGWWHTTLAEVAQILQQNLSAVLLLLNQLAEVNIIELAGPFENRGYFLLQQAEPEKWQKYLSQRYDDAMQRLEEMVRFCQTTICRRQFILSYFGESKSKTTCDTCDNCTREMVSSAENTELVQKILSCVMRMHEQYGVVLVAEVLAGSSSAKASRFSHLSTYGLLGNMSLDEIKREIRRTLSAGYLRSNSGKYPILSVTPAGQDVLRGLVEAALPDPGEDAIERRRHAQSRYDPQLFEALRQLRTGMARSRNIPPYVIFSDRSLKEMATFYPISEQAFRQINGVGEEKMRTLAPKFMKLIKEYVAHHRAEAKFSPANQSNI